MFLVYLCDLGVKTPIPDDKNLGLYLQTRCITANIGDHTKTFVHTPKNNEWFYSFGNQTNFEKLITYLADKGNVLENQDVEELINLFKQFIATIGAVVPKPVTWNS